MQTLIALANKLADESGNIIRPYFRAADLVDETKGDDTPVTAADRAVEKRLREIIETERPDDGIIGEEFGVKKGTSGYDWVLDPIDGTKSFMTGRATFGTLIALCHDGVPVLGVIDQPIQRERWVGAKGFPTLFNGKPVKVSACATLKKARAASTSPQQFSLMGQSDVMERLERSCRFVIWGGDCYSYGLIALGSLDLVIENGLKSYDFAALVPVVEGAGGVMCDWQGRALSIHSGGDVLALGDPRLKADALALISG